MQIFFLFLYREINNFVFSHILTNWKYFISDADELFLESTIIEAFTNGNATRGNEIGIIETETLHSGDIEGKENYLVNEDDQTDDLEQEDQVIDEIYHTFEQNDHIEKLGKSYFHIEHQYDTEAQKYICTCGRQYKAMKYLKQHKRWECGIEPNFACLLCPFKTKRKSTLKRHTLTHRRNKIKKIKKNN